jgi:uncharacterized protein YgiM (DUF1202 family)
MKMNYALVFGMFLTASLVAQTNSSSPAAPAAAPAPMPTAPVVATNKPAAKPVAKKPAPKRSAVAEKTVSLMPGPAVVDARNVNIRGRSTIMSEVLGRMTKGDSVTVIEQVENKWAKGDDMKQWARIVYPTNSPCWVFASFVDSNRTVTAPKLNVRGGPGENYSVVARITKGTVVNEISTKGEWMRIVPPEGATAFMAAMYLKQDAVLLAAAEPAQPTPPVEPASTNVITDLEPAVAQPMEVASTETNTASSELAAFAAEVAGSSTNTPEGEPEEPLPPRIVMREGMVSGNTSIQAPSYYGLAGMDTGRTINYLYTTSTNVDLRRYVGRHIIATGEESLDKRWPNTPVLTLQRIQVVDDK